MFRSTDQGTNWAQITNGLPTAYFNEVTSTLDNLVFLATSQGLYRSMDFGDNWERIDSGFSSTVINGVLNCSNGDVYAYLNWSIYRSTNNGLNWISLSGLPPYKVTHLTSDALNNLFLTLSEGTSSIFFGYRSTDQGLTWEQFGASCPVFFHFVKVSTDGSLYIQGQFGIYRSTNLGESWLQISSLTDSNCLSFFSNEILFAGSLTGVRKSTNAGVDWNVVGLPIDYPRILSLATNSTGIVFAGGKGNFPVISKTTNQGQEWLNITATFDGTIISALELDEEDNLFAGSYGGGIYYSTDFGATWVQRNNGLTDLHITALKLILNGEAFVGTDNGGIFYTTDYGLQWNPINEGLTVTRIEDIAIATSGNIYIGTTDGVFGSTNHGLNWTHLNNGWTQYRQVISIAVNSQEHIFAENSGYGIYRSTDFGSGWTQVSTEIWSPIMDIFINSIDTIFVAGANGVFRSTNNGEDWTLFNSGLAEFNGTNSFIIDNDGKLIAGTEDRGVCWTTDPTASVENVNNLSNSYSLFQNYPNPFNPFTTISYSIKERGLVQIKIYDLLGNEMLNLVNEEKSQGNYSVKFDGSILPSGVYFYSLRVNDFLSCKKMILLK
ncbi:MAG: T9SS type A sorting domain-containing protein [bacterium]|nr:T9SS type A sorting domain-containing protein [bacterium]